MNLSPLPIQKFFDNNGRPLVGGLLFTYAAGTTTKIATYQDQAGTPNTNPIVLNYRGEANVWLDQTLTYKFVLSPVGDTDPPTKPIWTVDNISAGITFASLTQQILGLIFYPRTAAEIAASVTPVFYYYPELDARRYGFAESATSSVNIQALQQAMLVAKAYSSGATATLPPGTFTCGGASDVIDIPQYCGIVGAGMRATRLLSANDGNSGGLFRVGGPVSTANKYGCKLTDLTIILSNNNGVGMTVGETIGAFVARVYIEGPIAAVRASTGIIVDGGNSSSFFNVFEDVVCNHIHFGFVVKSTGSDVPTQQTFIGCTVIGDLVIGPDTTSVGLQYASGCGNGSVWISGNFEACGIGFRALAGCASASMYGARFEANTNDIRFDSTAGSQSIFSPINLNTIDDHSNVNYHRVIATVTSSNTDGTEYNPGVTIKRATVSGQTPMIIEGFPGDTTTEELLVRNSSLNKVFSVTNQGKFARINNQGPVAVNAAAVDLATAIALLNQIRAALIADGICA